MNLGSSHDNGWSFNGGHPYANSQAYRADVTSLVKAFGNGTYSLSGFGQSQEANVNGASLIAILDSVAEAHDVIIADGNDSNDTYHLGVDNVVHSVVAQSDGKIVLGGQFQAINGVPYGRIARVSADGNQDFTFASDSGANGPVLAVAVQQVGSEERIVLGGSFTQVNGLTRNRLARLQGDGSLDVAFGPPGGADGDVCCALTDSSGRVLIAGGFGTVGGAQRQGVARLNADGSLDSSFHPTPGVAGVVTCLAVDGAGKILVGGQFTSVNGAPRKGLARLNPDGSLDSTFDPDIADGGVNCIVVQTNGRLVIGGLSHRSRQAPHPQHR